jgi:hypothetical protein
MNRKGGRYIKNKDGSVKRVEFTQRATKQAAPAPAPVEPKREVKHEDA